MFKSNAEIYKWAEDVAQELEARSESKWAAKLRAGLYGFTSGEALGAILSAVSDLRRTHLLEMLGREGEADQLVVILKHALHLENES